eukprot:g308.t1
MTEEETKRVTKKLKIKDDTLTEYAVEEGIEEIEMMAFSGCSSLRRIKLPKGLRKVGHKAFSGCRALRVIHFEDTSEIPNMGLQAFQLGSKSLRHVRYGPDIIDVPTRAFMGSPSNVDFTKFVTVDAKKIALRRSGHRRCAAVIFAFDMLSRKTRPDSTDSSVEYYEHPNLRLVYETKARQTVQAPRYLLWNIFRFVVDTHPLVEKGKIEIMLDQLVKYETRVQVLYEGKWYDGTYLYFDERCHFPFTVHCDEDPSTMTTHVPLAKIRLLKDEESDELAAAARGVALRLLRANLETSLV